MANEEKLYNKSDVYTGAELVDYEISMSIPEALLLTLTFTGIILLTVTGNVMVIISIFIYRPLRSVQNMFLISLAVADITLAVIVMPIHLIYTILDKWIFGVHICEMWLTFDVLCCTASILNLCAIALDRYWAIHDPINYARKRTMRHVLFMISCVWVISALVSIPPLLGWNDWPEYFDENTPCKLSEEKGYVIYSACGTFYVPMVIMTIVYFKIYRTTRKRLRERAKASSAQIGLKSSQLSSSGMQDQKLLALPAEGNSSNLTTTEVDNASPSNSGSPISKAKKSNVKIKLNRESSDDFENNGAKADSGCENKNEIQKYWEEKQKISLSKERRAARVLGVVMGVFVACWLPYFIMYVANAFCSQCRISKGLFVFMTWLGYVNSSLNPVIYTIFNIDFRHSFHKLFCCQRI
ncbi:G-protein coupled receptor-like protein [Dinothrombium tinctorium]|uniref:G-protein coupled receptor-like protein n=1 Tax=Dinothrombium tinctorium TaxID=1965070 RepID=A0A3S3Q0B7_9ACAR|nr:G-protein coupled receptor-like protein [Dinothrombium tinctorium]